MTDLSRHAVLAVRVPIPLAVPLAVPLPWPYPWPYPYPGHAPTLVMPVFGARGEP